MSNRLIDEPRKWNNKCPICKSDIHWYMTNSRAGAKGSVYCANNIQASTLDASFIGKRICSWEGFVVRQKDGGIRFCEKDGTWLRELL